MAGNDSDLKLDPLNPPKYCPHCAKSGLKTKVKKFKLDPNKDDLTIMCKNPECPWPFSVVEEPKDATVKEELVKGKSKKRQGHESSSDLEASRPSDGRSPLKKKAKLDLSKLREVDANPKEQEVSRKIEVDRCNEDLDPEALDYEPEAEKGVVNCNEINEEVACGSDDTKADESYHRAALKDHKAVMKDAEPKEGRIKNGKNCELNKSEATSNDEKKVENQTEPEKAMLIEENKGIGENYGLNSTSVSKEDECTKLDDKSDAIDSKEVCGRVEDLKNLESTTVNEKEAREAAIKAAEESNKDLFNFTRIPVKVREPLKLPRHAADMFSSGRPISPSDLDFSPDSPIPPQSPPCALSDVSESDSELESLASECSTMTAVSELSMGDEDVGGDATGKIKKRGMKKKRKDRRRQHGGKCSKEQPRSSDLAIMTKVAAEDAKESKIKDGRVELVEARGKIVEIVELKVGTEKELSLEQNNLTNSGVKSLALKEPLPMPMEVEIVTRSATSSSMSIGLPCNDPPASQQSIFEPESESSFEPQPMSTEPSSKDTPLPLPVAMSVSPQLEPAGQTDAPDMKSDEEEGLQDFVVKDVDKVLPDELQKSTRGEKSRQGIRVLLPKGENELDTEEDGLESTEVESLNCKKGVQEEEEALFKSPMRPSISSPARTVATFAPPESPTGSQSLGNLSPASLPSPGYTPRAFSIPSLLSPMPATPRGADEDSQEEIVVAAPTPKSRPAGTFLEKLAAKLTKKQGGVPIGAEVGTKETGVSKSVKVKGRRGKKGRKPSKFGTASFMSEESSSEEEESKEEGLNKKKDLKTSAMKGSLMGSANSASVGKKPGENLQSRVEKLQNQDKPQMVIKAMQDPSCVPGITASATIQASPKPHSAASSIVKVASMASTRPSSEAVLLSPRALPSSPGSPARLRLVVPVTGSLSRLPTNLVPCAPPPHLRMRAPLGSPVRSPKTSCSSKLVGSPRASNLVPCSPPSLRSPPVATSSSLLPLSSLSSPTSTPSVVPPVPSTSIDRAAADANLVPQRQNAGKEEKTSQSVSRSVGAKTFTRRPKTGTLAGYSEPKALMSRRTGLGIDATQDKDICIDLPTLSLAAYEPELPGFDTVLKLGCGATERPLVPEPESEEESNDCEVLENSVVFHVANQAMITQPTGGDNLEVKEQGSTRVLLTASSNQIEVHDLKEAVNRSYQQHQRGQNGAAQLLPDAGSFEKHGRGWFQWKDWRVDEPFINGFSSYMTTLVTKWRHQLQPEMDPKISALLKEREAGGSKPEVMQKIIIFFAEVFVKFLFIKSNFPSVSMDRLVDVLRRFHTMDNTKFSDECNPGQSVHALLSPPQEKVTEGTGGRRTITVVRPADMTEQAKVAALAKQNLTPVTASGSRYQSAPPAHQGSCTTTNAARAGSNDPAFNRSPGFPARSPLSSVPNLAHQGPSSTHLSLGVYPTPDTPAPINLSIVNRPRGIGPGS